MPVFLFFMLLFAIAGRAQTPDAPKGAVPPPSAAASIPKLPSGAEVMEKYVKAIGGRDALLKYKTLYQSGSVELLPMGVKGTIERYEAADAKTFVKLELDGVGTFLDAFDGKTGWTSNPLQGFRVKSGQELQQVKRGAFFYKEVYPERIYSKLVTTKIDKVGERPVYVVVGSSEGLPDDTLYFDTETDLLLRSDSTGISPEGQQAIKTFYDDYQQDSGIKAPRIIRMVSPTFEAKTVITVVKRGEPIDDAKFAQPN